MTDQNINNEHPRNREEHSRPRGGRGRGRSGHNDFNKFLETEFTPLLAAAISNFAPFDGPGLSVFDFNPNSFTPISEIYHEGNDVLIRVELAGFNAEDISVELENGKIAISGEKRDEFSSEDRVRKLNEVRYGKFRRIYPVTQRVSGDDISAEYKNGVLIVRVTDALKKDDGIKITVSSD